MTRFAHYTAAGQIIGFYSDDTHKVIPEPHIEISEADLLAHATNERPLCVDLSGKAPKLKEFVPPPPSLDELKAHALAVVRDTASTYRRQIAKHVHEDRAIAWVMKTPMALAWLIHEDTENPALAGIVAQIKAGFEEEASVDGEDAKELRDACITKGLAFGFATQLVEGMERMAERRIPAAQTPEELQAVIAELQAKQDAATAKLTTLTEGQNNA